MHLRVSPRYNQGPVTTVGGRDLVIHSTYKGKSIETGSSLIIPSWSKHRIGTPGARLGGGDIGLGEHDSMTTCPSREM